MIQRVARAELRTARLSGHCGWCDATAEPGRLFSTRHNPGCRPVNDAWSPGAFMRELEKRRQQQVSDGFWDVIEAQLKELRTATTADEVLGILSLERNPLGPGVTSADGFFAGSGGEGSVWESLIAAGWYTIWSMASCHWAMRSPDSRDAITYVEGDIYRGNRRPV